MAKATGFLEHTRELPKRRPVVERVNDYFEVYQPYPEEKVATQASRCMDCGVPFCHTGCPLHNLIPDWNDLVYQDRWREAIRELHATNNFPEFTGRTCPAPCEAACVLGINEPPVTIKNVENTIIEHAFREGWVVPEPPLFRTGKRVAVVGSGPAGLAAAQQLNRAGHLVTVFEREDRLGGLLRYGIPDFKMEKWTIDRRLEQLAAEGIEFRTGAHVGGNVSLQYLRREFHAVLIATGAEVHRDITLPGRDLKGIHFAMEFLPQQNRVVAGDAVPDQILATGKRVVIIGGGDTGADCLGTCHRQKAEVVHQLQHHQMPPEHRSPETPWPLWPMQLRLESSHEEGGVREWGVQTLGFSGDENGHVRKLHARRVGPAPKFEPVPGSEFEIDVDLVLIAIGFQGPVKTGLLDQLGLEMTMRGSIHTDGDYKTSVDGIFAAGDARRGQSIVVWAIAEGRRAARAVDCYLMGSSQLPE